VIKTGKNIYDKPESSDGKRILVMRLWPRGISKDKVDVWMKDLGTDLELIRSWKAGNLTWSELSRAYDAGLKGKKEVLKELADESRTGTITLLCGCRDERHCHRVLLKRAIQKFVST